MDEDAHVLRLVRRIAVLRDRAGALPVLLGDAGLVGREQRAPARALRRQPHVRVPADDRAGVVDGAVNVDQLLRSFRIPAGLVLPRPLHAHGCADRLRDQHRVGGRMIAAVGAVRSGAVEKHDAHLVALR